MLRRLKIRGRRRSRGQSLVEFALVLPVMLLIVLMGLDFGRVFLGWVELNNIAKIGANYAALNPDGWDGTATPARQAQIRAKYTDLILRDAKAINCVPVPATPPAPVFPDASPNKYVLGSRVQVSLACKFRLITPFLNQFIGDVNRDVPVSASAEFAIRGGPIAGIPVAVVIPTPTPTATPTPTPTPSPTPTPTPTPTPPGATPTPTPPPAVPKFYGTPTSLNSAGGGLPGSIGEMQIVGVPTLSVQFTNTSTGTLTSCLWAFGDGQTLSSCAGTLSHSYAVRSTYNVSLTVNGSATVTRTTYVLVGCQVPDFHGVKVNNAGQVWTNAGFTLANLTKQPPKKKGSANYDINFQSLSSGQLNPVGGCANAVITVGP